VKTPSEQSVSSPREKAEKKKWVEPVGGLANGIGDTQHRVVFVSISSMDAAKQSIDE